ncbi:Activity-regulated cytoskeleton associated protein 2 [Frankliniella fusca]|uniref:Activity-regulated cytoskeleton associated protein 2 n=1 Tax=Frankliniella fusca TaxID=407009 RepID=A0AAE1H8R9_9NEOP|nr:Activity-regulated cytoskeleton associated protein 2 [Frankliniella fusca]
MEVERLRKDELMYELVVGRGANFPPNATVEMLRENLKSAIRSEALGVIFKEGEFDSEEELLVCSAKLDQLKLNLSMEENVPVKRCQTLIYHLNSRLFRNSGEGRDFRAPSIVTVSTLRDDAFRHSSAASMHTRSSAPRTTRPEDVPLPPSVPSVHSAPSIPSGRNGSDYAHGLSNSLASLMLGRGAVPKVPRQPPRPSSSNTKSIAFHKWNCSFSGARDSSVNSFIERIEELAEARGVGYEDLLRGAPEFFVGQALVWYRSIKNQVTDWESMKALLKKEYLPVDYQASLMDEIRNRRQGKDEPSSAYIACMQGLFDRLEFEVEESDKLQLIMRNMAPFYVQNLPWQSIISINHLKEESRQLEVRKSLVDNYESGYRSRSLLEPDLAYKQSSFPPSARPLVSSKPFVNPRRPVVNEVIVPPEGPEPEVAVVTGPEEDANPADIFVINLSCKEDGRLHVNLSVYERIFFALLDSGASRSIVGSNGWEILKTLRVRVVPSQFKSARVANGSLTEVIGVVSLPLVFENYFVVWEFLVIPSIRHDFILGIDFLNMNKAVADYGLKTLNFTEPVISCDEVIISKEALPLDQVKRLESIIEKYRPRLGRPGLGCTHLVEHSINTVGLMGARRVVTAPMQIISCDLMGPLPRSSNGSPLEDGEDIQFDREAYVGKLKELEDLRGEVQDRLKVAYEKNAKRYNLRRRDIEFEVSNLVYRKNFVKSDKSKDFNAKLAPKFIGPFKIKKKVGYRAYLLEDNDGNEDGPWYVNDLKNTKD